MKSFPKDKTALNGRVFRSGLYSAAITAAVLVLAVLVNLLVRALPTKYTTFDLSEAGLYTPQRQFRAGGAGPDAGCDHLLPLRDRQ